MKTAHFFDHSQIEEHGGSHAVRELLSTSIKWLLSTDQMDRNYKTHMGEINRLAALSDAELMKMGITRVQISAYVFRDVFGFDDLFNA